MTNPRRALLGLALLTVVLPAQARKKLIETGWDQVAPGIVKTQLARMEQSPFDGIVMPLGKFSYAFCPDVWPADALAQHRTDLKECKFQRFTDNFVIINANPGNVDWFDDQACAQLVDHWRQFAKLVKDAGLKGILFDPEPYTDKFRQFDDRAQPGQGQHSWPETCAKVRQRGREVMTAIAAEKPDLVIYSFWLGMVNAAYTDAPRPQSALVGSTQGLLPAFVDGWLDVAPPTVTLIDGCEMAYLFDGELAYLTAANRIRSDCARLQAPENRFKYRAQVQVSFGVYLDAYINPVTSPWHLEFGDVPRTTKLQSNVATALRVADEYVWVYGEQCRWWPPNGGEKRKSWEEGLPGITQSLALARDPGGYAVEWLAAHPEAPNLAKNGDCTDATGWTPNHPPLGWGSWQWDYSKGTFTWDQQVGAAKPGAARASNVVGGCFILETKCAPGERYAVRVKRKLAGNGLASIRVRWQTADNKWTLDQLDRFFYTDAPPEQWADLTGAVTIPAGVGKLVMLIGIDGQKSDRDVAWFDDAVIAKLP